jgi:hypothetical protein
MKGAPDLSGRWSGHYSQHEHPRPVTLMLAQNGGQLTGTMRDHCRVFVSPVSEIVMVQALPPGTDEQIVKRVRMMCPNSAHLPVQAECIMPEMSSITGAVSGTVVRFLKVTHGEFFSGYRVGNERIGMHRSNQTLSFSGTLNGDGTQIEGHWFMPELVDGIRPVHRTEGSFLLAREIDAK